MIEFREIRIETADDYRKLLDCVPFEMIDDNVIECLKNNIGSKCDCIKVEYPYYDRDYLSTYYGHYSRKFKQYPKECCRLHIEFEEEYYGYITLRPTVGNTKMGKSYLAPELLVKGEAYLMLSNFVAHIHGQKMSIMSFPWKRQQTDISCCAHTALWSVLRYYGNKYNMYADATIGNIVEKVKNDWGRETPSLGLTPVQVSDLLKEYGFAPLVIGGDRPSNFIDEILAYVESGIPMIGFLGAYKHAIAIVGHGEINYDILDSGAEIECLGEKPVRMISHTKLINSVYVMDDQKFAYKEVPISWFGDTEEDYEYGMNELLYAVIPLYNRMQLTYGDVYNRMLAWLEGQVMEWEDFSVYRIYITSSNSLKQNAMESSTMPRVLKDIILGLSLPRFVWCIDLAGMENYKNQLTTGRIIIDTTAATWEREPWILRHDMNEIQYKDYDTDTEHIYTVSESLQPYTIYENNLTHVKGLGV